MIEHIDQQVFLFLNSLNSPFWDKVMSFISMVTVWFPLYLAILIFLGFRYKRKFMIIVLFIIMAISLSDQTALLIKNTADRLRPCHEPSLSGLVHLVNGKCGGLYGFVSSHAANAFNVALLSIMFIKKRWFSISMIIWASVVGYSRIYLGVHYPGDVLVGSLLGSFIGLCMYSLYALTDKHILQHKKYFTQNGILRDSPPEPAGESKDPSSLIT